MENCKAIKGFKDYLIFTDGRIFSFKTNKYLKPWTACGYYKVGLCKDGNRYYKYIARLVAQAFIPNPDNKSEINHIDGIKANNDVSNLEWVTRSENMQHAFDMGLKKPSPNAGATKIPINVYGYKTGNFKSTHTSLSEAARFYGVFIGHISQVLTGTRKQTGGLTFTRT